MHIYHFEALRFCHPWRFKFCRLSTVSKLHTLIDNLIKNENDFTVPSQRFIEHVNLIVLKTVYNYEYNFYSFDKFYEKSLSAREYFVNFDQVDADYAHA